MPRIKKMWVATHSRMFPQLEAQKLVLYVVLFIHMVKMLLIRRRIRTAKIKKIRQLTIKQFLRNLMLTKIVKISIIT